MSEYHLKSPKQAEAVVKAYHKVEDTVVGAYHKVEDSVVGGYKAIEKKFVDTFLEKVDGDDRDSESPSSVEE